MTAYKWVDRVAAILDNEAQLTANEVRRCFQGLLGVMAQGKSQAGEARC